MVNKTKLIFILLLLLALLTAMYSFQDVKEETISELYEEVTFMRIATEAQQYINQIEYGIKNGRQLENFFNMQETLKGVQGSSSYMEGAYVVSTEAKLLYERGIKAEGLRLEIPSEKVATVKKRYTMSEDKQYFYLTSPIKDGVGEIKGYLIMCLEQNAVKNAVSEYNNQNRIQSWIIVLEVFGVAVLLMSRMKPDRNGRQAFKLMLVLSLAVTVYSVLDSSIVLARFYQIVDDTTTQTANKMAQALQSQVDSVVAKGISTERIYDLNGWLAKNTSELEIVTSLTLDRNNKITANVSTAYINGFLYRLLFRSVIFVLTTALSCFIACASVQMFYRSEQRIISFAKEKGIVNVN